MLAVMFVRGDKTNYLLAPNEVISWIKVDRIITMGHIIPSVVASILIVVKFLPEISTYYSIELEKNSGVISLTVIILLLPISIYNGILIEYILEKTDSGYFNYKKEMEEFDN
jgi:hypothetical protein